HLAEVYRRELALKRGYSSEFKYAREELGLSDAQAWERVNAAKLALELPEVVGRIASGELTLASAGELWRAVGEQSLRREGREANGRKIDTNSRAKAGSAIQAVFEMGPSSQYQESSGMTQGVAEMAAASGAGGDPAKKAGERAGEKVAEGVAEG